MLGRFTVPGVSTDTDDLLEEAVNTVIQYDRASASLLQRRLSIGYARAARLMDQLQSAGVLSPSDGSSKPRKVLIKTLKEFKEKNKEVFIIEKQKEINESVKKYTPVICDFLPEEVKSLNKPTDLPYLKTDLENIGNLIVTGNVISNKYEYIKTYLLYLLSKFDLNDARLILNDYGHQLNGFKDIPHLLTDITSDPSKNMSSLRWLNREIDRRIELLNKNAKEVFPAILYIGNVFDIYNMDLEDIIKRISSIGAYAKIHLILFGDRLGDFPKPIKDNIPARLEFNKFREPEAVFSFKEKTKITVNELKGSDIKDYLLKIA